MKPAGRSRGPASHQDASFAHPACPGSCSEIGLWPSETLRGRWSSGWECCWREKERERERELYMCSFSSEIAESASWVKNVLLELQNAEWSLAIGMGSQTGMGSQSDTCQHKEKGTGSE